jgi:hypothetical protein
LISLLREDVLVESFIGRLGGELLNETLCSTRSQARAAFTAWEEDFHVKRPPLLGHGFFRPLSEKLGPVRREISFAVF